MNRETFDPFARWGIEYRPPGGRGWTLLGTVGDQRQARSWLLRFHGSGDYRLRQPTTAGGGRGRDRR